MRTIKFRAWDVNEKMTYFELNPHTMYFGVSRPLRGVLKSEEGYELMQFTGLTDNNGVEIYDGDIVQNWHKGWKQEPRKGKVFVIEWEQEGQKNGWNFNPQQKLEIIGNIHQNPELL